MYANLYGFRSFHTKSLPPPFVSIYGQYVLVWFPPKSCEPVTMFKLEACRRIYFVQAGQCLFFCLFPVSRTSNTAPTMVPSGYVKTGNSCWRLHWCRWSGMISVVVLRMPSRWPRPGGMNPTNHGLQLQSATCSTQRQLKFYVGFLISVFQHSYTRTCSDIQAIRLGCVTGWVPKNRDWSHTVLTIL